MASGITIFFQCDLKNNLFPLLELEDLLRLRSTRRELKHICDDYIKSIIPKLDLGKLLLLRKVNEEFKNICDSYIKNSHHIHLKKFLDHHQKTNLNEVLALLECEGNKGEVAGEEIKDYLEGISLLSKVVLNGIFIAFEGLAVIYWSRGVYVVNISKGMYMFMKPEDMVSKFNNAMINIFET